MERARLAQLLGAGVAPGGPRPTVISEAEPRKFMAMFATAVAAGGDIFLCDPSWGEVERGQAEAIIRAPSATAKLPSTARGWLMLPTGGTAGRIRFARHDAETIVAAVHGFTEHFRLPRVNAVGVLPLFHVSGLMARLRCALTGGNYLPVDWKEIEAGRLPALPAAADGWTISLVPTQLERLLRSKPAVDWLRNYRVIFVGGGPAWTTLLDRAVTERLPLALSYGMTETAAMVTAQRPEEFLAGDRSCGTALPHASISLDAAGAVSVEGGAVFCGYYPEWRVGGAFATADAGFLADGGRLHITGRRDAVIITGGEKVQPTEVEAALRDTGEFAEVAVVGVADAEWGQVVAAVFPATARPGLGRVVKMLRRALAPQQRPKYFVPLTAWPVNAQGKVNRALAAQRAGEAIRSGAVAAAE